MYVAKVTIHAQLSKSCGIIVKIANESVNKTAMKGKSTWSRRWSSFDRPRTTDALGCFRKLMNQNSRQYEEDAYQEHDTLQKIFSCSNITCAILT